MVHCKKRTSMTAAERQKKYREKLKQEGKYEEYKRRNLERKRKRPKVEKSEEQIEKQRKQNLIRKRRFRQKLKDRTATYSTLIMNNDVTQSKNSKAKLREYWKEKKRESRAKQTDDKKRQVREYDKVRHRERRSGTGDMTPHVNVKQEVTDQEVLVRQDLS